MILRPYQEVAWAAVYEHLRTRDDHPCVVMPTGSGKSPLMAALCKDAALQWQGRVLILAHVKELLEQAADKLRATCPELPFGVYSAGLARRDTEAPVIVAGIQSVYKRACELGAFDLIFIDESHLIPADGEGMYRQFLADAKVVNPAVRLVGFTATPFRLRTGALCTPEGLLNHVCFEVGVRELIRDGYLCPLVSKAGRAKAATDGLHLRGGEFIAEEAEALMDQDALVEAACAEIVEQTVDRHAILIFAAGIKHGEHIVRCLAERHGIACGCLAGETPAGERTRLVEDFRNGRLRYLANVNVLTTGFDAPNVDCVVLLRPTMSPGLLAQQVGRGLRLHSGKRDCLVLDFGGNLLRHGPIDALRIKDKAPGAGEAPAKECPDCHAVIAAGYSVCPHCGHAFPPPERTKHDPTASMARALSGQVTAERFEVRDIAYRVHRKRGGDEHAPCSLRVDYKVGFHEWKSEWVCFEHEGYARRKAEAWWRRSSPDPVPATAAHAAELCDGAAVAWTKAITVRTVAGDEFERIVDWELGDLPEPIDPVPTCAATDWVPF
jgi:DNA repair protein RadD